MSTIVAPSTPPGRGAIAVVRLSGELSLTITRQLAPGLENVKPRRATLATIRSPTTAEPFDEVLITYFDQPHSVTGEDVVEISCHGSPAVVRQLLDWALMFGARLAAPGEFTLRAVANHKINLVQAEAIRDLIAAQTGAAVKQAARQIGGELSKALKGFEERLIDIIVLLESALEFVEDDLPPTEQRTLNATLTLVRKGVYELAQTYSSGRLLQTGIKVAIVGSPNVGKSSLFNRLVERDRAIVTALPGTTRDTLSETIDLGGIPVLLTDTAGLRETIDTIESLGIERTQRAISDADLVLHVIDGSTPQGEEIREGIGESRILILNKCDLPIAHEYSSEPEAIRVSALTGEGLESLRAAILEFLNRGDALNEGLLITNARHYDLLNHVTQELDTALVLLKDRVSEEMVLVPLHNALKYLGQITGETTTEDILSQVFSTFCIGK